MPDTFLHTYLAALLGPEPGKDLLELRYRLPGGMAQRFHPAADIDAAARDVFRLGRRTDVYVGVAPRSQRSGGRRAVRRSWTLWVDCDDHLASDRVLGFEPAPSIVIRSGTPGACHAYWLLTTPLDADAVELANRRMAVALGADVCSSDAARILRPPGTLNFKHRPPSPVVLEHISAQRLPAHEVLRNAPRLRAAPAPRPPATITITADPLRAILPDVYVRALLGVEIPRNRKIVCPFHDDHTPSLHVYPTPEGGWYCFGCGRGTTIYDMAAALWDLGTRGRDFVELRRRLIALMRIAA